jgi:BUD22
VLKTRLKKDRILSQNEHVRSAASNELVSTLIPAASGTPTAKCESRLLSSKLLAAKVTVVVEDLRNLLQPKNKENDSGMKDEDTSIVSRKKLKQFPQEGVLQGVDLRSRSEDRVEQIEDAPPLDEGSESDTEEADDAGWESGTVDDNDGSRESGSLADSDSDGGEELRAPSTSKTSKKSALSKQPPSTVTTKSSALQSSFLPSLSVGFVRGASDDSELGENAASAGDIDFKKNRRGQRARRA